MSLDIEKKTIKKNFIINLIYQLIITLLPIVVMPYISRVIGSEGLGKYSFALSLSTIVSFVAALGTSLYGQKQISICKTKEERTKVFLEIIIIRTVSFGIAFAFYFAISFIDKFSDYKSLLMIDLLIIFSNFLDISWFYLAVEKVSIIAIRNLAIRAIITILVFVLIKSESDLFLYTLLMACSSAIGMLLMWIPLHFFIKKPTFSNLRFKKHLKNLLILFVPVVASSIYSSIDKTMITLITGDDMMTGWYTQANTVIGIAIALCVTALSSVSISRVCQKYEENNIEDAKIIIYDNFKTMLSFFMVGLIIMCSSKFVVFFFGEGYDGVKDLLKMLSPIILIMGMSNILGQLYFFPTNKYIFLNIAVGTSILVNIALNLVFVHFFSAYGAAIASVISETVLLLIYYFNTRKYFSFALILSSGWKYLVSAFLSSISIFAFNYLNLSNFAFLALSGITYTLIYILILALLKEDNVFGFLKKLMRSKNK